MGKSSIPWCTVVWNILHGCTKVSAGCVNCWSLTEARMRSKNRLVSHRYEGVVKNGRWTGRINFQPDRLQEPRKWKDNQIVFVASQSDLFHALARKDWVDAAFDTMERHSNHAFLILTKRPESAVEYLKGRKVPDHVWLGVSVENQQTADFRTPLLLEANCSHRFISVEPMLGHVDISKWIGGIEWVICGCESGKDARPMHTDWARSLRDQCAGAGVPFFLKQIQEIGRLVKHPTLDGAEHSEFPVRLAELKTFHS